MPSTHVERLFLGLWRKYVFRIPILFLSLSTAAACPQLWTNIKSGEETETLIDFLPRCASFELNSKYVRSYDDIDSKIRNGKKTFHFLQTLEFTAIPHVCTSLFFCFSSSDSALSVEACIFLVHTALTIYYNYESTQCCFIHKNFNGKLLIKKNKLEMFYFRLDDMGSAEKVWEFVYDQDFFLLLQSAKWALQCCVYYKGLWHRHVRLTCFWKIVCKICRHLACFSLWLIGSFVCFLWLTISIRIIIRQFRYQFSALNETPARSSWTRNTNLVWICRAGMSLPGVISSVLVGVLCTKTQRRFSTTKNP